MNEGTGIDFDERKLILKLIEDPFTSISQLARELNQSRQTISRKLSKIENKIRVQAILDYPKLKLKQINCILECSYQNLVPLERTIDEFPYSMYRVRIIGKYKGLFAQFTLPETTNIHILTEYLFDQGIIDDFIELSPCSSITSSNFRLTAYDQKKNDFVFDWTSFSDRVINPKSNKDQQNEEFQPENRKEEDNTFELKSLEPMDMYILSSMTKDARLKGLELLKPTGTSYSNKIPSYVVSRRFSFLKEHLIPRVKVQLDWELFNIYQPMMIVSNQYYNNQTIMALEHEIKAIFPFDCLFYRLNKKNNFYWFVALPPSHFPELMKFIWKFTNGKFDYYSVDYHSSEKYLFYGQYTFDFSKSPPFWKDSVDFLLKDIRKR